MDACVRDFFTLDISMIVYYWLEDKNEDFEKTDAFVGKSVNTFFDFMSLHVMGLHSERWAFLLFLPNILSCRKGLSL
jgi:hypothetical protein